MNEIARLTIDKNFCSEKAWDYLEAAGCSLLYSSEDLEGNKEIYAQIDPKDFSRLKKKFPFIASIEQKELPQIDWEGQWRAHSMNFHDGLCHVDLLELGAAPGASNPPTLLLKPGAGFGDLSHPSTHLVLKMMMPLIKGRHVIDLGCGSGILSLAAIAFGAKFVLGIDIDEKALAHAQENALLNHMKITFIHPSELRPLKNKKILLLMNMISSEQAEALKTLEKIKYTEAIVSGILHREKKNYLKETLKLGWHPLDIQEQEGWLGIHFFL